MSRNYLIFFAILMSCAFQLNAQQELIYNFDRFSQAHGLSQGQVFDLEQDVLGRLWIATYSGGVTIIDGSEEEYLTKANGLPGFSTTSLFLDFENKMWIGTNKGACYFNGYSVKVICNSEGDSDLFVWDICSDANKRIWLATDQGIWYVKNDTAYPYDQQLFQYPFYTIAQQPVTNDLFFYSSIGGLYQLTDGKLAKKKLPLPENAIIERILFADQSKMLVGTTRGLYSFNVSPTDTVQDFKLLDNKHVVSIGFDYKEQLWVGTSESGIYIYENNKKLKNITAYQGIGHNRVYSLFQDQNHNMWVGTDGAGIALFKGFRFSELKIDKLYQPSFVMATHFDRDNNMWIGTEGQGVVKLKNGRATQYTTANGLSNNYAKSITSDRKGRVYVATNNGVNVIYKDNISYLRKSQKLVSNQIEQVFVDSRQRLWVGTFGHGVQCVDSGKLYSSANGLTGDFIWDVFQAHDGKMYIGTDVGVTIIENDVVVDTINRADGLFSESVADIAQDGYGNMWIAVEEGVACYSSGELKYYPLNELSQNNIIYSIIVDKHNRLLMGTENGIVILNIDEHGAILTAKNYGRNEGFFGIECNANAVSVDANEDVYWGTANGVTKQIPGETYHTQAVTPPAIKAVLLADDKSSLYNYADSIEPYSNLPLGLKLPYDKNNITFHFGSPEFFHKEKIRYRYKLIGLNEIWSSSNKQTQVNYNHLSPGDYTLAVQSLHADYPNNEAGTSYYSFTIVAPITSTWWFRTILGVVLISIFLLFWNYRIYALRKRKITLQKLVRERTRQLSEQKDAVIEANKEIRRTARLKEQFLANTSHEMRTPLNVVIGFSNLLLNEKLSPAQKKYTENIRYSGEHLNVIINDLLDLSKIEADKMTLNTSVFNYRRILLSTFNIFKIEAENKDLETRIDIEKPVHNVKGDAVRLTQIISNLLRNAIKFTESGSVEVASYEEKISDNRIVLHLKVADSGIGIPKSMYDLIFQSFTQVAGELTRKYGGTGLGLSIVKKLVDLHNGTIRVESTENQGTVFYLSIPYEVAAQQESVVTSDHAIQKDEKLANRRILVVDDNEINLSLAHETLSRFNSHIQIDVAYDGKQACQLVDQHVYDLIIMDIQMPVMNGYDATKAIRQRTDEKANVPILGMTAHAMKDERQKCLDLGMNDYLSKPFSPNTLLAKIQKIMPEQVLSSPESPVDNEGGEGFVFTTIDIQKIKSIVGNAPEKEYKYLKMLNANVPTTLEKLTDGLKNENAQQVKVTSHSLKSTFRYYGAANLSEVCKTIENFATDGDLQPVGNLVDKVISGWQKIEVELAAYFRTANPPA
ncbi:MAG: response regulator [Salinivirgaceae bacterium]|nr:response regulator [Salinivirgaceae bacterium]